MVSNVKHAATGLVIAWMLVTSTIEAGSQMTGQLAGTVRDATGAALPGATVIVTGPLPTDIRRSVTTDARGRYLVPLLQPSVYDLLVELEGFHSARYQELEVAVDERATVDVILVLAGVTEQIDVSVEIPIIEVERSDVTWRVSGRTIDDLPLNGRNFVDLMALAPGARPMLPSGVTGGVSLFGERPVATSFIVDGIDNNDPLRGGPAVAFSQDAIQEFEVVSSGYRAEFGRAQGGVVNVVTRSGSNRWNGRTYWFNRNDRFDASNVLGQPAPALSRHQWGGTIGGPVRRDKLFFFGSLERLDESRGLNVDQAQVPDFVKAGAASPTGRENFEFEPVTDSLTGHFKLDARFGDVRAVSLSIARNGEDLNGELASPVAGTLALPSAAREETGRTLSVNLRGTALVGVSSFLETTVSHIQGETGLNPNRAERPEPILLLLRSGFLQTGAPFGGRRSRRTKRTQVAQALSWLPNWKGDQHQLKVGWDINRSTVGGFNEVSNDVEYSAAFLAPNAHEVVADRFARLGFQQSAARFFTLPATSDGSFKLNLKNTDVSVFAQDSWRPRGDLTFDVGLRYDWASLFGKDRNNVAPRLGMAWDIGERHRTIVRAAWGTFFDRNLLSAAATVPEKGGVFTRSAFDVALPRLGSDYLDSLIDLVITSGFPMAGGGRTPPENPAYLPFADAIRSNPLALYHLLGIAVPDPLVPPIVTADTITTLSDYSPDEAVARLEAEFPGTDWEFFDVPGGSIVGDRVLSFFPRGPLAQSRDVSRYAQDRVPWTNALSVGVEQQLGDKLIVGATFVRRRSRALLTRRIVNLFDAQPGDPQFGKTTDGGPRINQVTYEGRIDYDGVVVTARWPLGPRHRWGVSYTVARGRDNLLTGEVGSTFSHNNRPELDYGPSNQSVPQSLTADWTVRLPWEVSVSGVMFWRSGSAFNPRGIRDLDGDGLVDQRDTSEPRNRFRAEPFFTTDLRVEKRITLGGRHVASALMETFNLANRANVSNVSAVAGPAFGTPTTFFPGREIQIGIRYFFGGL